MWHRRGATAAFWIEVKHRKTEGSFGPLLLLEDTVTMTKLLQCHTADVMQSNSVLCAFVLAKRCNFYISAVFLVHSCNDPVWLA